MKNAKRRIWAWIMTFVVIFTGIISYYAPDNNVYADETSTVVIHYQRDDGDYAGWDVWVWPDGSDGTAVSFTDEDSFGKVAVYRANATVTEAGFIVRQSDWSEKDCDDDRFVSLTDGFAEIWVTSGEETFEVTPPEGAEPYTVPEVDPSTPQGGENPSSGSGDLTINLHYHRYDNEYANWNIWYWPDGGDGARYEFTDTDDFGVVSTVKFDASVSSYGFIVKYNEWDQKECDMDRFIDTSKAVDGVIDVYIVQSDTTVYYDADEADLSPKFLGASLTTAKRIAVKVTVPVDCEAENAKDEFVVKDQDGNTYEVMNVFSTGASGVSSTFNINMQEPLDLSKSYTISSEYYGDIAVAYGEVFTTSDFENQFTYTGNDLGATYTKDATTFKVWSPTATKVVLNLYENGTDGDAYQTVDMTKSDVGVWETTVDGDLNKVYYTYSVTNAGVEKEAVDLYARTTGVNGQRGMVIDLSTTNPEGWDSDKRPGVIKNATDAIIYELHIRDFTIDESSGVTNKGKYLGLTEKGTKNATGQSTCLDYLANLGITHVQILPMYDYSPNSVDETKLDKEQFNWGYDPYNYNAPEGSYSTDPYNGEVRVNEMKQMVQALHNENIGVIMDVVYNHTAESENSYFNITVPDYYYRQTAEGGFSNASGCGNEVASDRAMVRKYIVDSVVYWASEYHIDGFRFDLMGILDLETMNEIRAKLNEIDPTILVYGEGWTGGDSPLSASLRAMKVNTYLMENVGAFSDDIRDGIKGSVFDAKDTGFATGKSGQEERIKSGVIGATNYPSINWSATGTDVQAPWTNAPVQALNYVSCHDNLTLWDKINSSNPDDTLEDRVKMNKLAASIVYTAQGIPFMLDGEEILRTKPNDKNTGFVDNSYKSSDYTNSIKWDTLNDETVADVLEFYKGLISFRKTHSGLRMYTAEDVQNNLKFLEPADSNVVAYVIENQPNGECSEKICVIYNANNTSTTVSVPDGEWKVCIKNGKAGTEAIETFTGSEVTVDPISCLVMVQGDLAGGNTVGESSNNGSKSDSSFPWWIIAIAVVVILIIIIIIVAMKKKGSSKNDNVKEKICDVKLLSAGANAGEVAKAVSEITGLPLAEATDMVNNTPKIVKGGISVSEAETIKSKLEGLGASVKVI